MMHELRSLDRYTLADLPVFLVRSPVACFRDRLRAKIGTLVVIDGGVYGVRGVESFAVEQINEGAHIGIWVTTATPVRRIGIG